jgi:ribose transport system substrate-binding protein
MKKRKILAVLVCAVMVDGVMAGCSSKSNSSSGSKIPSKLLIGVDIRSLSNPYLVTVADGAKLFAASLPKSVHATVQILQNQGSDETEINNVKALLARGGHDTIMYVDANNAPNIATIAPLAEKAGVYWGSVWNIPAGYQPSTKYPHWVLHQSPDDETDAYNCATEMFKDFKTPNQGNVLAIQGLLSNTPAINRFKGLQKALSEHPGVKLLDQQAGNWEPQLALNITESWLSKYSDIDGIWCANDDMAVAVVQALKQKGLNGKVQVTGNDATDAAVADIQSGDMTATVSANGEMQGGYTLAYAYAALTGKINTATMDQSKRMINTKAILVTKANVNSYVATYVKKSQTFDFNNLDYIIDHVMNTSSAS